MQSLCVWPCGDSCVKATEGVVAVLLYQAAVAVCQLGHVSQSVIVVVHHPTGGFHSGVTALESVEAEHLPGNDAVVCCVILSKR